MIRRAAAVKPAGVLAAIRDATAGVRRASGNMDAHMTQEKRHTAYNRAIPPSHRWEKMSLVSLPVFVALLFAAALFFGLPVTWRARALAATGFLFTASVAGPFVLLYVALGIGAWWMAGRLGAQKKEGSPVRTGLLLTLGALVLHLVVWKWLSPEGLTAPASDLTSNRDAFPGYSDVVVPIGLSFLTFRLVHVVIERTRGRLPAATTAEYLAWLLFPPLVVAGPLQRLGDFHTQFVRGARPTLPELNAAALRIVAGLVKKLIVADTLGRNAQPLLLSPEDTSPPVLLAAIYGAALQLYFDFSGYSDVAIGLGRLFGIRVPENFDWPIFARDLPTFWRRWHMTLHTFFRDYVFLPVFGVRAKPLKTYLGVMVTVFLFQVWHQLSPSFLFLGFFHGVGVVGVQAFQQNRRRWPALHRAVAALPPAVGIGFTFTWFAVGNVVFMTSPAHLARVFAALAAPVLR